MRFDPQANFVPPGEEELLAADILVTGPNLKTPLKTAIAILVLGFVVGTGVWLWSESPAGRQKAAAEAPTTTADGEAVIRYAESLSGARESSETGRAATDNRLEMLTTRRVSKERERAEVMRNAYEEGRSLMAVGRHAEAVPHLAEAIRLDPDFADGHYRLALAYLQVGNINGARSEKAVLEELDPSLANLLGHLIRQ
jgi:Flp pilus assembly protein TadD